MSIILDALRRGRGRQTPASNDHTAQTDAVLQTLGYGRFNPTTRFTRLKRIVGGIALGLFVAFVIWGTVIWITQTYFAAMTEPENVSARPAVPPASATPRPEPTAPPTVQPTQPPSVPPQAEVAPAPTFAPSGATAGEPIFAPGAASTSAAPQIATMEKTAGKPAPNAPKPLAPVAPTAPVAPIAPDVVVQPSQRVSVPSAPPAAPSGAPTSTALSTAASGGVTPADDPFARAMMYQRLGEFENALVAYREVLKRDDVNVEAHNNLGVLYRDKGLLDDATRHFQRAIAIKPGYARARNNLGVVYLTQRKLDLAASQFHTALAIDAKNVESLVNLSTVEKELGRREPAREWLRRALEIDPRNAEAHYNLGLLEDEAGNRAQALAHYRLFVQYGAASHPMLVGEVRKRMSDLESKN